MESQDQTPSQQNNIEQLQSMPNASISTKGRQKGYKNAIPKTKNVKSSDGYYMCVFPGCVARYKAAQSLSLHKRTCPHAPKNNENDVEDLGLGPSRKLMLGNKRYDDVYQYQKDAQKLVEGQDILSNFDWNPEEYLVVKAAEERIKGLVYSKIKDKVKASKDQMDYMEDQLRKAFDTKEVTEERKILKSVIDYIFLLKTYIVSLIEDTIDDKWHVKELAETKEKTESNFCAKTPNLSEEIKETFRKLREIIKDGILTAKGIADKFRTETDLRWREFEISCNMQLSNTHRLNDIDARLCLNSATCAKLEVMLHDYAKCLPPDRIIEYRPRMNPYLIRQPPRLPRAETEAIEALFSATPINQSEDQ